MSSRKTPSSANPDASRRDFIKKSALAAGALATGLPSTLAKGSVLGANDRLNVGFVGVGGQGFNAHVRTVINSNLELETQHTFNYNVVGMAACDLYSERRERARKLMDDVRQARNLGDYTVQSYEDHRHLIDDKDVDVVFIGTVDHWHAQVAIDALDAGKHVYCEKPMTRYLGEAFNVHDAVKRTGLKFQVGSQYTTEAKWHKAAELIKAGKIGPPTFAQNSYMRNSPDGEWNYYALEEGVTPVTMNWEHWLGPVANRIDFNLEHYHRWRKYLPYCAGILGDLLAHMIHPLVIAANITEFPTRVVCIGNNKVTQAMLGPDDRSVTDNTQLLAEFPSGLCMLIAGSTVNEQGIGQVIRGHEATLYFGGNSVELRPERPFADLVDQETHENLEPGPHIPAHVANLFDAIRNDTTTNGNIDVALVTQAIISMAEASERYGESIYLDPETRTFRTGTGTKLEVPTYGTFPQS
jgi:predicted dehydrogenase